MAIRAALFARWTNIAKELEQAHLTACCGSELSDRAVRFAHLDSEIIHPGRLSLSTPGR
jgi:hypothetical protein